MARARNIKPGFFQNEELCELPPLARILFAGLWTIADYRGVLEWRPKRIKTQLLPYDDIDICALVQGLKNSGFVRIFSVQGREYVKVVNFERHQSPHKNERESGSEFPDISEADNEINDLTQDGKNRSQDGTARADCFKPLTDSLNPRTDSGLPLVPAAKASEPKAKTTETWTAYADAYRKRYGVDPVRNAKVSGQLSNLVNRIGAEEAPSVAAYYLRSSNGYYVQKGHSVDCLLADCEKLRTEWATGRQTTQTAARQTDRTASNPFLQLMSEGWTPEAVNERAA